MKRLGLLLLALLGASAAQAQPLSIPCTATSTAGPPCVPVTAGAPLPVTGTFSATLSGFAPATTGTPITATTGGATGTLPAGVVVLVSNVGTTNTAYCKLGASATTADQPITPNGGWFAFTVGAATQLACITSTSTTTVNMSGGSGLATGTGGGGGGSGGGGAITAASGSYSSGALSSGSIASGAYASGSIGSGAVASGAVASGAIASGAYASGSIGSGAIASGAVASGAIASGAYASGSIGSGAVASGAFASGALASGSIAAGAQVDLLTMRGTKNAGTAAANSLLAGGVYNSSALTLTDTQQASLQSDVNGYLKVNVAAGGAAGGTSSNFGSAFPTPGTAVGFSDGTNMVAAKVGAIANVAAATNMLNVLPACNYNATPLTVTDTRYQGVQCDVNGYLKVSVTGGAGITPPGQAVMAASTPVAIASNQSVADPCMFQAKTNLAISQNGTSSVQLIGLSGSTVIYVCSLSLIAAGATTVALTTGTGTACVTGNAAVIGSTTANIANSMSFAANGGMTLGNGGSTVARGAASSELCMILGTSVYVSGNLTYVQQ